MADAYRIAFEEQLSRNRALARQLVKRYSLRNGHPSSRKGTYYIETLCDILFNYHIQQCVQLLGLTKSCLLFMFHVYVTLKNLKSEAV